MEAVKLPLNISSAGGLLQDLRLELLIRTTPSVVLRRRSESERRPGPAQDFVERAWCRLTKGSETASVDAKSDAISPKHFTYKSCTNYH